MRISHDLGYETGCLLAFYAVYVLQTTKRHISEERIFILLLYA